MKNPILFLLMPIFIFGLLIQPGCKTTDESADQYTLTVVVGTGVSGIPATGSYAHDAGQTVSYGYSLQSGYQNLVVTLDGTVVGNFGIITMNSNHTLSATAGEMVDYDLTVQVGTGVSGIPAAGTYTYNANQTVSYNYTLESCAEDLVVTLDGTAIGDSGLITMDSNHTLNAVADQLFDPSDDWEGMCYWTTDGPLWVTFNGDCSSGTTEGRYYTYGLHTGTYTISGNQITFDLVLGSYDWRFEGTIDDNDNMSGTWVNQVPNNGTWDLVRQ